MSNFEQRTKRENRILKIETRNSKRVSSASISEFRFSIFDKVRLAILLVDALILPTAVLGAQVETLQSPPTDALWTSHIRVEGHLAAIAAVGEL